MTGEPLATLNYPEFYLSTAVFSPDGGRVLTISQNRAIRTWDAASGRQLARLGADAEGDGLTLFLPYPEGAVGFSPDGRRVVAPQLRDFTARIWDAETGKELVVLKGHTYPVMSAQFSADGKRVVTASWDKTARIHDAATGTELVRLAGDDTHPFFSACFSPDGRLVLTRTPGPGGGSSGGGIMPACLWEAATGKKLFALHDPKEKVYAVSFPTFSADGRHVVIANDNRHSVSLWDTATGKEVMTRAIPGTVRAVFPDGPRVAALDGTTASLWDVTTGKELATVKGHGGEVSHAAFTTDGRRALTQSADAVRVWDTATGEEIITLSERDYRFYTPAFFSPDGRHVLTQMTPREGRRTPSPPAHLKARVWPVEPLSVAVARKPRELTPGERQRYEVRAPE